MMNEVVMNRLRRQARAGALMTASPARPSRPTYSARVLRREVRSQRPGTGESGPAVVGDPGQPGDATHGGRARLEQLVALVDAGKLRPQAETVLPLERAREALAVVAARHTRGKVVLQIG
jgi:NADPH:quinone reductase-like Zn-dependent oxidoreductase